MTELVQQTIVAPGDGYLEIYRLGTGRFPDVLGRKHLVHSGNYRSGQIIRFPTVHPGLYLFVLTTPDNAITRIVLPLCITKPSYS